MSHIDTFAPGAAPSGFSGAVVSWLQLSGRIRRGRYWFRSIMCTLGILLCVLAVFGIAVLLTDDRSLTFLLPVSGLLVVPMGALMFAKFSAGVRRLHDRGKTGYWILLYYLVPCWTAAKIALSIEGLVFLAITLGLFAWSLIDLGILRGDPGRNAFGPDPLAEKD